MASISKGSDSARGGVGFLGLLALIFITLKLTHFIDWSWWWVLSPLWIIPAIVIVILVIAGIANLIFGRK